MSVTSLSIPSNHLPVASGLRVNRPKHHRWPYFLLGLLVGLYALLFGANGVASDSTPANEEIALAESVADQNRNEADPLTPEMRSVLIHVSRRYRVASTTLEPIFVAAQLAGNERRIDPLLIVSVIGVESGFNPFAESTMGAQGLMQVIPRFHLDKVPSDAGEHPFLDPVTNVRIGVDVLHEAIRMRGSLIAGLQQYAGSSDPAAAYASKVLAEKRRLERIAGRPNIPSV